MPVPPSDPAPAREARPADDLPDPPVPGRGQPSAELGLRRLRSVWLLRATAVLAFMGYGGLVALLLARKLTFGQGGTIALLSLASWFFLFWWYPVLERTTTRLGPTPRRQIIGGLLEAIALGCVVLVHVLMAIIVVYAARN